jgi:hypothetical protein
MELKTVLFAQAKPWLALERSEWLSSTFRAIYLQTSGLFRLDPTSTHHQPLIANHKQCAKLFAEVVVPSICDGYEKGVYAGSVPSEGVVDREACFEAVKELVPKAVAPAASSYVREPRAAEPRASVDSATRPSLDSGARPSLDSNKQRQSMEAFGTPGAEQKPSVSPLADVADHSSPNGSGPSPVRDSKSD